MNRWSENGKIRLNGGNILIMVINCVNSEIAPLMLGDEIFAMPLSAKILGIIVDKNLNFKEHVKETEGKRLNSLNLSKHYPGFKRGLKHRSLTLIYKTTVFSEMLYRSPVWARAHASKLAQC